MKTQKTQNTPGAAVRSILKNQPCERFETMPGLSVNSRKKTGTSADFIQRNFVPVLSVLLLVFSITSCNKDIEMCVEGNMNPEKPGEYTYTWCGDNDVSLEWAYNGVTYGGPSVTLKYDHKTQYTFEVRAKLKRKRGQQTYVVNVGTYEIRVEPKTCDGQYLSTNGTYNAYLYAGINTFQTDFRNQNKLNCLDSVTLIQSSFYQGTNNNSEYRYNGGFSKTYPYGNYLVYVERSGTDGGSAGMSNLSQLLAYGPNLILQNDGEGDDLAVVEMNSANTSYDNACQKNLLSKTFVLSNVWLNGTSTGVSPCNADDQLIFNADKTWQLSIGNDDCGGGQSNSSGTFSGFYLCENTGTISYNGSTTTGTFAPSFSLTHQSETKIKITAYVGGNTLEQEYTAQ